MLDILTTADIPPTDVPSQPQREPSLWVPEYSDNQIIEWHCGECHKIIYYALWQATYCPHCGAPIFNYPRRKLDAPQHRGMSYKELERMQYDGPGRTARPKAERQADHQHRPGKTAHHRRQRQDTTP